MPVLPLRGQVQLTLSRFDRKAAYPSVQEPPRTGSSVCSGPMSWELGVEDFVRHLQTEGTVGAEWVRRIRWHVLRTPSLLGKLGFGDALRPEDLRLEHVQAIRGRLGWERNTLLVYYAAIRQFLRFLHLPLADSKGVWNLPSGEATHRRWLRADQLSELLCASQGAERLVIALEGYNGLRRVEVLRLRARDVDLDRGLLRVCGKGRSGGKWRTIPLTSVARTEMECWLREMRPADLLLPRSASWVDHCLKTAAERANLRTKVSNHDLRRTFGRVAHQSGMGLVDLKNVMGHQSIDMTTRYIGLDEDHMRDGLARFDESMARIGRVASTPDSSPIDRART